MAQNRPDSKKRRREPYNVDIKLIEIYEDLASEKDDVRLKAAQALVSQFTPDKNPTDEQIQKALQRLFRGLCSSRKAARIGFSIALTEILSQVFATSKESSRIDLPEILNILESQSNASGSDSGQEQRDHYFGRLFGSEAIIKSSILFKSDAPFSEWPRLLDLVFDLAQEKPWLREECGWVIYRCIYDLSAQKADAKFVEAALECLSQHELVRTPEGVAIWLAAKDLFPNASFPSKAWKHDDPLDEKERNQLAKVMKDSSSTETGKESQENKPKSSGVWNSKLHFAWDAVINRFMDVPANGDRKSKKGFSSSRLSFVDFWTEVVDNGLFASASSEERKYWGFLLFAKVLNESPLQHASQVFTKNLVRCLMNQLAVEDRYLHRMAAKSAKSIQARVSKEPQFAAAAISGLMGSTGFVNFDQVSKTKTVEKIAVEANLDALKQIVPLLGKLITKPGTGDSKAAASSRQYLANLLMSILRSRVSTQDNEDGIQSVLEHILTIFVRYAYFTPNDTEKGPHPAMTPQTQELFRSRINSCLNSLIASQKYAAALPYAAVRKIRDAAKSEEYGKFIINIERDLGDSVKVAFKSLKKMDKKEGNAGVEAFKLLYSMTILQVYNGDADAVSMLDELQFCYSKFVGDEESQEETSDASDTLVEILLSFASKQSQLFRRMSEQVFGAFADKVTATGLESLISILEAKENAAGQEEMFEKQGNDEDGDEDMVDVDEEDSDVEVVGEDGSDDGDEGGDSASSDDDDEEDDGNDNEEAEFNAKLAEALGPHRAKSINSHNHGEEQEDDDEGSDDDMNDDEMEQVDTQLAKVFKARRDALEQKKDKKDAKENMVNFKNRVLDLLEIYVKKCHSSILALDLILPLLRLSRNSTVKQISNKATVVLREYTKLCKGSAVPVVKDSSTESAEAIWELLRDIHKEAMHSGPPAHAGACSQASLLVVKVLVAHDKKAIGEVVDVYAATRKDQMLSNKCHIQPAFFTDWNNWCVSASKQIKK